MTYQCRVLQAVIFDWAGTTVDHGSCAPAIVFKEIFRRRGIDISTAQAREPMGMAKRDHIATIAAMPGVAQAWINQFGASCSEADVDAMGVIQTAHEEPCPDQGNQRQSHLRHH